MNIKQDLSHNCYSINPNSLAKKIKGEAIPDVIVVIGNTILIIEENIIQTIMNRN